MTKVILSTKKRDVNLKGFKQKNSTPVKMRVEFQ